MGREFANDDLIGVHALEIRDLADERIDVILIDIAVNAGQFGSDGFGDARRGVKAFSLNESRIAANVLLESEAVSTRLPPITAIVCDPAWPSLFQHITVA